MSALLSGEHAVVTGASRGIGAAIAAALAAHGARVSLLGRDQEKLEQVAALLPNAFAATADVTDAASVRLAFERIRENRGPVHALVNNAGQARSGALLSADDALWHDMLAVNLTGVYYCTRAALPDMLQRGRGRIVNIASTAGLVGYPYVTAYCAAKHGVIGFTRALALELARKNISVNAVCPGYTDTDLVRDAVTAIREKTGRDDAQVRATFISHNPQGRLVQPDEVAQTVLWLCTAAPSSITGQSLAVAGGEVM